MFSDIEASVSGVPLPHPHGAVLTKAQEEDGTGWGWGWGRVLERMSWLLLPGAGAARRARLLSETAV